VDNLSLEDTVMADAHETLVCSIEYPSPVSQSLSAKLTATFTSDGIKPTTIINSNQKAYVKVKIDFEGSDLARAFCLYWCVKIAFEGCGKAAEGNLEPRWLKQTVCENQSVETTFEIPADTFKSESKDCGDLYALCVTAVAFDSCRKPLPFAGFCKDGNIMVFPAAD
jgi:hypothetical protein